MKDKIKFFTYRTPLLVRKNKWVEMYLKVFHKKKFYRYMRVLAKQRVEEREFFKLLAKQTRYENIYKDVDFKALVKGIYE